MASDSWVDMARGYRRSRDAGREAALRHIAEAKELSDELGGTDKDVKAWFFSLPEERLNRILREYGTAFGTSAENYARQALPRWRSGATKMSGLVASRLFSLLPKFMDERTKFSLVESLWKHVGPREKREVVAGKSASIEKILEVVEAEVRRLSTEWELPISMRKRFEWLSGREAVAYTTLLSHVKNTERAIGEEVLKVSLPNLKRRLEADLKDSVSLLSQTIEVGRQSLEVRFEGEGDEIIARRKTTVYRGGSSRSSSTGGSYFWFWVFLAGLVLYKIFS